MKDRKWIRLLDIAIGILAIIIVAVLVFEFRGKKEPAIELENVSGQPTVAVQSGTSLNLDSLKNMFLGQSSSSAQTKIDLNGPLICRYKGKTADTDVYIKNKNIFAGITQGKEIENFLVSGDCIYDWSNKNKEGQKYCGISSYLSVLETISNLGVLNMGSFMNSVPTESSSSSGLDWQNILKSCIRQDFDASVFNLPDNIVFKNVSTTSPTLK